MHDVYGIQAEIAKLNVERQKIVSDIDVISSKLKYAKETAAAERRVVCKEFRKRMMIELRCLMRTKRENAAKLKELNITRMAPNATKKAEKARRRFADVFTELAKEHLSSADYKRIKQLAIAKIESVA